MKRSFLAALATLAAIAVGGVLATSGGAQQPGARTLTFVTSGLTEGFVDNPPRIRRNRLSAGDSFLASERVANASGQRVGTLYVECTAITRGRNPVFQCDGTFALDGGTVAVSAVFGGREGEQVTGAVVGGTGDYVGARGRLTSRELSGDRSEDTLHLLP